MFGTDPGPLSAQSLFARLGRDLRRRSLQAPSAGVTLPSSLLQAHAPVRVPPLAYGVPWQQVFAGCCQPRLQRGPSRRYLHDSFPGCLDPYPGGPFSAFTRFFLKGIGLPHIRTGRLYHHTPHSDFRAAPYFGTAVIHFVSSLRFCSPPRSLPPQPFPAGQPWLCRPGPPRFVASPQSGPANRPNRAIDGVRTFTSPDSWPCRLLP